MITQPSTSNPPNKPPKMNRRKQKYKKRRNPNPNWLELPEEVWFTILSRLKTIDIIDNAQKVCMLFRKLCKQPVMFRTIDMFLPDAYMDLRYDVNVMTRYAVERSAGGLVDITLVHFCDDDTLMYIVDRSKNLKRLVLQHYGNVSDECLIEAVRKLPMLKQLQLIFWREFHLIRYKFSYETLEAVGRACPSLESFSLTQVGPKSPDDAKFGNEEARAIARSMPQLRHLELIRSDMTNEGLKAILDGCRRLESLYLLACFHIDSGDLGKRCERIKCVWQAYDPASDEWGVQQESEYDSDE